MISFIVIGKNEENNLKRTIEGIYKAIAYNKLESYEIIYVDSQSTDRSIEVVKQFPGVKIFLVTGQCNAAVGRNIGAKEAKGDVFFFIDADMEISGEFLDKAFDKEAGILKDDFVSGILIDVRGDRPLRRTFNRYTPEGIFLIRADIWKQVQGMRTKYTRGENYDLGLRVAQKGFRFKKRQDIITNHYKSATLQGPPLWKAVWNMHAFYPRCVLLRDHLFTLDIYFHLVRNDKSFILMVAALFGLVILPKVGLALLALYLFVIIIRALNKKYVPFLEMTAYYILTDILNLVYFFTFFPREKKEEHVRVI